MTNISANESQNFLIANTIWQSSESCWLYYLMDATLSKYSLTNYFPSHYTQVATEDIFEVRTNNT